MDIASVLIFFLATALVNHQITGVQGRDVAEQMKEPG